MNLIVYKTWHFIIGQALRAVLASAEGTNVLETKPRNFAEHDILIDETMTVSAQMPEQYLRKMSIVEALEEREDLTDEEVREVVGILRKRKGN